MRSKSKKQFDDETSKVVYCHLPPACLICTGEKVLDQGCSPVDPVENLCRLVGRRLVNAPVSRGHCLVAGHIELGPLLVESRATRTIR